VGHLDWTLLVCNIPYFMLTKHWFCKSPCVCDRGNSSCSNKGKFDDDDDDDEDDDDEVATNSSVIEVSFHLPFPCVAWTSKGLFKFCWDRKSLLADNWYGFAEFDASKQPRPSCWIISDTLYGSAMKALCYLRTYIPRFTVNRPLN